MTIATAVPHQRQTTISLTFPNFPDFSLTTKKYPDFSRFSRWLATSGRALDCHEQLQLTLFESFCEVFDANESDSVGITGTVDSVQVEM